MAIEIVFAAALTAAFGLLTVAFNRPTTNGLRTKAPRQKLRWDTPSAP